MSKLPPLNALRAFEATARLGSVVQAARELNVTHGAVSRHLKTLDGYFECALFERAGRQLALTADGHQLYDDVHAGINRLTLGCQALLDHQRDAPIVLRCPGSFLARWLIPHWAHLKQAVPGIDVQVAASDSALPQRGERESAVVFLDHTPSSALIERLLEERIGPVVSPALAKRWQDTPPSALVGTPLLHTTSRAAAWTHWATARGLDATTLTLDQGFEHLFYLLEAAVSGIGVAIAPELLVKADIDAGRLVAPWGFEATGGHLVLCSGGAVSERRHRALAEWFHTTLAKEGALAREG
ncbi:LysR family transcriptional regulator [Larsenimonas salina]|uniref:LysR family transcriptional regulator n=1 Tax=Larsenimonas salina TaxID=1295565 RepID=UPI00207453E1|nr:LysR family transcriptional regulator [Larsenimonas salina]MCM5704306.1 LysR family transcriptional regulator [Larsenimonas salina]